MFHSDFDPKCEDEIRKAVKKDKPLEDALRKKIRQILENPYSFKPLRTQLDGKRRVHVLGCYVLIYKIEEQNNSVVFLRFAHHDQAYKRPFSQKT